MNLWEIKKDYRFGLENSGNTSEEILEIYKKNKVTKTIKMSSSLKFCILAAGEADIYAAKARAFEWDIAAGHAILEHAGGSVVDHNFKSPRPKTDTDPTNSYVKFWDDGIVDSGTGRKGTLVTEFNITQSISNYQYHVRLNDKKRGIYVLKPTYLQQFLLDSRKLMKYSRASQTVSDTVKRVTNIRLLSP